MVIGLESVTRDYTSPGSLSLAAASRRPLCASAGRRTLSPPGGHMTRRIAIALATGVLLFFRAAASDTALDAQGGQPAGRSIGRITTRGDLIVFELADGVLGTSNLFDLEKRTLRFTPATTGYRVEN